MGDGALWVGVLTAVTALGASLGSSALTSRGNAKVASEKAIIDAHAAHITESRNRRRDAYRELGARVHDLSQVFWRMDELDLTEGESARQQLLQELQASSRLALNGVEKAVRDVHLEGPSEVAKAATELGSAALVTRYYLCRLTGEMNRHSSLRETYELRYRSYDERHRKFVDLARQALEVPNLT